MANGVNKVILIGNLGRDPELNYTASGQAKLSFGLATGESYKDKAGDWKETTTWHNVVVWGRSAEALKERLFKGARCYLEGKISNRSYEKDGQKKYISEVVAWYVIPLDKRQAPQGYEPDVPTEEPPAGEITEDDVPF